MTNLLALADEVILAGEKATPGPWYRLEPPWLARDCRTSVLAGSPDPHVATWVADLEFVMMDENDRLGDDWADAAFIALTRTAAPALAQAYKECREVIRSNLEIMEVMRELCDAQGMLIPVALYTRMESARAFLKGE